MRRDITSLPVGGMVIGFLLGILIIAFTFAFIVVQGEEEEVPQEGEEVAATPTEVAETPTAAPSGLTIAVSMGDNFFDPDEITVPAGATVTFDLTNGGQAIHNMRIAGLDGEYDTEDDTVSDPDIVRPGETAVLTWTAPSEPGEIIFRCDFHPIDMVGRIIVE